MLSSATIVETKSLFTELKRAVSLFTELMRAVTGGGCPCPLAPSPSPPPPKKKEIPNVFFYSLRPCPLLSVFVIPVPSNVRNTALVPVFPAIFSFCSLVPNHFMAMFLVS